MQSWEHGCRSRSERRAITKIKIESSLGAMPGKDVKGGIL